MLYRYAYHHPIYQAWLCVVGFVGLLGVLCVLTHGLRYGGAVPAFFYVFIAITIAMLGVSVKRDTQGLIYRWYKLPFYKHQVNNLKWVPEGKLWRLVEEQQQGDSPTTILARNKEFLQ
ncbi:hypothetical protein C9975_04610 [Thalassospira xiamenensis]|nr:hypothetical protein C9975_04610 [Thalassospira xiamenensis]